MKPGDGVTINIIEIDDSLFFGKRESTIAERAVRNFGFMEWLNEVPKKCFNNWSIQGIEPPLYQSLINTCMLKKGSSVYSDQWYAYFTLTEEGYNGCCTNTMVFGQHEH